MPRKVNSLVSNYKLVIQGLYSKARYDKCTINSFNIKEHVKRDLITCSAILYESEADYLESFYTSEFSKIYFRPYNVPSRSFNFVKYEKQWNYETYWYYVLFPLMLERNNK